jgi:putative transposase
VRAYRSKYHLNIAELCKWAGISESSYHYQASGGRRGAQPSSTTTHSLKGKVLEKELVADIKKLLGHEFIDCGYRIMTEYLKKEGYQINHKKVYRIMDTYGLLKPSARIKRGNGVRKFVKFRKVKTSRPLECLEMDIKMVWIPKQGKNAYLLSVIDVHTRKILADLFAFTIKQKQVIELLGSLFETYGTTINIVIRSDNGSQFIATSVREYLGMLGVEQEFTHVATPEENAHIESYHGILKRDVFDRFEYHNFGEIEQILKRYVEFYNSVRIHGLLGKITPNEKWEQDKHLIHYAKKVA